jgi:hypothetical protein
MVKVSMSSNNPMQVSGRNMHWEAYLVVDHDAVVKQDGFLSKLDLDA